MSFGRFQFRRGTAAQWASANPILASGEIGIETDTAQFKIGDGITAWNSLPYGGIVGPAGRSVVSIDLTSGTGAPGTTDTYTITYSSGPTDTFDVYNGADGAPGPTYTADNASLELSGAEFRAKDGGIGNVKLATMAANTVKVNATASAASPTDLALAAGNTVVRKSTGNIIVTAITDYVIDTLYTVANATGLTALLNVATTTLKGLLSAVDKIRLNNLQYDVVADFGFVGNDSTDNKAAWDAMIAALPVGAQVYFPPGTYRTSGEFTIGVDKRISFYGKNRYSSIIKTTSATANIFNVTIPAWYNSFDNLGFQSSVTKTAGAAIAITSGSAVGTNIYRCWMNGMFRGIDASGSQSGNLSVWADLDISSIPNGGRGIKIDGAVINVMIHNATINAGAATTSACCEINASGAVQVTACDWIQGTNVLLMNAASALGAQACYFTNCFFDQPQSDVILINGGFTINRVKFTQCGIATSGSAANGIHVNGTGAGAVGTATAMPAGISVVDCDIYHQAGGGTGNGIFVNGCQDINVQNSRITGYSGAGGCAIRVTPSASNQTRFRINGNILGPNSNLTLINTVGVQIDAGASAPTVISVTDNTMTGCTTAIVDNSTAFDTQQKNINNNAGAVSGFSAQCVPLITALTTVERVLMVVPLPPNSPKVGTTFRCDLNYKPAASTITTIRFRIGTSASVPATNTAVAAIADLATANGRMARCQGAITGVGGSAAFVGNGGIQQTTVAATSANTAASGSFNSAVQNYLMVTLTNTTSTTTTVFSGSLEVYSPS